MPQVPAPERERDGEAVSCETDTANLDYVCS